MQRPFHASGSMSKTPVGIGRMGVYSVWMIGESRQPVGPWPHCLCLVQASTGTGKKVSSLSMYRLKGHKPVARSAKLKL